MNELYNRIRELCVSKGVTGYRVCKDIGITPSIFTDLKMGRKSSLSATNANKIANYFNVSVDYLLTGNTAQDSDTAGKEITDDDIKFALFNGDKDITDERFDVTEDFMRKAVAYYFNK